MISANSGEPERAARKRRALPGRRPVWPLVVLGLVVLAGLGGAGWAMFSGRLPGISKPEFLSKLHFPSAAKDSVSKQTSPVESPPAKTRAKKKERKAEIAKVESQGRPVNPPGSSSVEALRAENASIRQQLLEMAPKGYYVVINTAGNRVVLHNGDKTEAEMVASCGSGNVLEDPKGGRRWTFDTPRGVFSVKTRVADPVWIKPDWAFIEEGEPIPKDRALRAMPGEMGDFAIGIGDGYYMHGTLYKRLLGRNVSHGCVRLGDADIDKLYHTLAKGDRVYIF